MAKGLGARIGRPLLAGALAAGAVAAMTTPATALADVFLKLGDIKGESTDDKHKDEIDILSYSQQFSNSATIGGGGGSGVGKVTCGAVTVAKNIDRSSPQIIRLAVTGNHVPTAVITFRTVGGQQIEYYKVTMTNAIVTSIGQSDTADPARIVENITLLAEKFKFEYTTQSPSGGFGGTTKFSIDCLSSKSG